LITLANSSENFFSWVRLVVTAKQEKAALLAKVLHDWMLNPRDLVPKGQ